VRSEPVGGDVFALGLSAHTEPRVGVVGAWR
jgi:hypothetical protein